ncbi:MAG: FGGY-family carbohydrate kinase [Anaerolineae bacterium]
MSGDQILSIDFGTQSVRALLFDLGGNLLARAQVGLQPYRAECPGWAEQDVEYLWSCLCAACLRLWQEPQVRKEAIAGVALTTQRATVVNVDRQGRPLRPAISWLDQRRTEGLKPVGGLWGLAFALSRMSETVARLQADAESNWIRTYQPEVWAQTHKYLLLSGYLTYRLTGRFADSIGCQVGYIPFDYKALRWAAPSDWKWQAVPMQPSLLPELEAPATVLGEVTPEAAQATGIPAGLPMLAAAADKACEVLGSGCLEPTLGCLSLGTTATINTTRQDYVEVIPLIPPYPSAVPGAYSVEIQVFRGFWLVSWFKREFGQPEVAACEQAGGTPEELFDDLVRQVPAGALGLMLQPYWSPGVKVPGPEAKGAIIGFSDVHTRAHIYRAILEGLAYSLREAKERIERRGRVPIRELRVCGGGSQSDAAMQITADIFGLPASRPHVFEASGLGAAIDAAVGLKLHPDFPAAVAAMTRVGATFIPNPTVRNTYDALYQRVYRRMYQRLQPLYEEIRAITGYPAR